VSPLSTSGRPRSQPGMISWKANVYQKIWRCCYDLWQSFAKLPRLLSRVSHSRVLIIFDATCYYGRACMQEEISITWPLSWSRCYLHPTNPPRLYMLPWSYFSSVGLAAWKRCS
jgi:hypothetical protein